MRKINTQIQTQSGAPKGEANSHAHTSTHKDTKARHTQTLPQGAHMPETHTLHNQKHKHRFAQPTHTHSGRKDTQMHTKIEKNTESSRDSYTET